MRLMLLTPGTGHFFCGSCLRDDSLGRALAKLGHDVEVVPLYLPLVLEEGDAPQPVHMGGINMYLQQKSPRLARRLPGFLAGLLDDPRLLRWASRRGSMTDAPDLGAMTVSMLQGEHGRQVQELDKLVDWVQRAERPDVLVLSNAMLTGSVHRLKAALDVPIVVTLQGEAAFLDSLPEPFSGRAWAELALRAREVDAFVPVSRWYGELMQDRLGLPPENVHVVHNGLDFRGFAGEPRPLIERRPPTIGYLARMCRDKGLHTLVEAFVRVKKGGRVPPDVRLAIAGVQLREDRPFVRGMEDRLLAAGCRNPVDFLPNIDRARKIEFLEAISVLSVPATYGESFGLYLLEAMAAGVPVVQPRHGAFPELIEATGGGVLCEPDDASSLADTLESILLDLEAAQRYAQRGRAAVLERFDHRRMASQFVDVCMIAARARTD